MKKASLKQLATACRRQIGSAKAFTLTELLVVIGAVAMLTAVLLSASFTTQEGVFRALCADNLRQIGVGLNIYSTEADGYLPQISWPQGQLPWHTYQACRNNPGTHTITLGPMGLGMLWGSKILPDPRVLYCPSLAHNGPDTNNQYSYNYYTWNGGPWPTTPPMQPYGGGPEVQVRTGYNYYPQQKAVETVRGYKLPVLAYSCPTVLNNVIFYSPNPSDPNPQFAVAEPCPIKVVDTDPSKAVAVDVLMKLSGLAHENNGQPAGANALFLDGHVKFQTVDGNSDVNQAFNALIWNGCPSSALGNDPPPSISFRRVMSYFQP